MMTGKIRRALPARPMILMGLMMAGAGTVDTITTAMLPITARHFTDNIGLIGLMVALNRICGFLVQPYAAWKSDRHLGAGGRRRPLLLMAWPATLAFVAMLGALPFVVPPEYQRTTAAIAVVFCVNLAMQACLDLCYGGGDPMYGDMFTSGDLGRASALRVLIGGAVGVAMAFVFVPLADRHEFWPYAGAMLFVGVSFLVARHGIRERIPEQLPLPGRYDPLKPLSELRNPQTRNVAIVASAVLVSLALTEMLHALFVTETLGFSMTVLGHTTAAALVVSFVLPYPVGWLVDRFGARAVLIAGFLMLAGVEAAFFFWVHDLASLYIGLIAFKVSWLIVHIPIVPLMFHNTPSSRRGSIFAAVQMTRAGATSVAVVLVSYLAGAVSSYRTCYLAAGLVCLIGLIAAVRLLPSARRVAGPALA